MNVFQYAANEQAKFTAEMAELGYTTFTTFFHDMSIAEVYGKTAIKDTYNQVVKSWGKNIKYFTEFVMTLNHKIWEHYDTHPALASLYNDLWQKAEGVVRKNFKGEDLDYYYRITD